ncbi:MAG: DUF1007 family protein [Pseudolabrys sp.]|nr:DUF1007 family protein [Pseudolabrys sp.]MBV9954159.1 DUF1007 family protein [Pseudolabrys sp.]
MIRWILALLLFAALASAAQAHPHIWVTMRAEIVYAPDGAIIGIKNAWSFDDMFSTMATQGIDAAEKGKFTREELKDLAEVNVSSLKGYDYFTSANADGTKVQFKDPADGEYWLDYKDQILTLNFTLKFDTPIKPRELDIEIYDPTYYIDFAFAKSRPVSAANAPADCTLTSLVPQELSYQEGKKLAESFFNNPSNASSWGSQMASKIKVTCPR